MPQSKYDDETLIAIAHDVDVRYCVNEDDHWVWKGATDRRGTPIFGKNSLRVRRIMWLRHRGNLETNEGVYSSCLAKLCVNPDHCIIDNAVNAGKVVGSLRPADITPIERLLRNVTIVGDCWIQPNVCVRGYGAKTSKRLSYTFYKGDVTPGQNVKSDCGNYKCINPDHLRKADWREKPALRNVGEKPKNWHLYKDGPKVDVPSRAQVEADMEFLESPRARLRRKFQEQRAASNG